MRIAYLDGFAGVSGDMLLGALIHAGASVDLLRETAAKFDLDVLLETEEVDRSGIHALKVHLVEKHRHEAHHHHEHEEAHRHHHAHRPLFTILSLIEAAQLPEPVSALARRAFELLGASEAKIHHVPVESVHFHEVGAVDAILDIVLTATAVHALDIEQWHCSPLNVGGGTITCAHGRFPVPAPATADLLQGAPTYSSGIEMELVTPTGAALIRALGCQFGPAPAMRVNRIGYGAGTRNPDHFANVLRVSLGETDEVSPDRTKAERVTVLETAVDDLSPQVIAYVTEKALQIGALDVMCAPVFMKKNRTGTLITLLSDRRHLPALEELLFRETSTLGFRVREERRVCLERRHVPVETPWGPIRIKIGSRQGEEVHAAPEFEDCRQAAETHSVPVKVVMEKALQIYRGTRP